jgi:hypothetical protein
MVHSAWKPVRFPETNAPDRLRELGASTRLFSERGVEAVRLNELMKHAEPVNWERGTRGAASM